MSAYSLAQAQQQLDRLVDEALTGETVTITRNGAPVVTLTPTAAAQPRKEIDEDYWEAMHKRALTRPLLRGDSVTLVREMRDEER